MIITVSISCVVAVAVLGGVTSFPDQQLVSETQSIGLFQKDHLELRQRGCKRKKACKRLGGNCESRDLESCDGQMLTGKTYCRNPLVCGCCVPPRNPPDCDTLCNKKGKPVCGGDPQGFRTYDNFCLLQFAVACVSGSADVKWLNDGICECPIDCNTQHDPVCGFDGQMYTTYQNNCSLQAAIKCDPDSGKIKFLHNGKCIICAPDFFKLSDECFRVIETESTWGQAQRKCKGLGSKHVFLAEPKDSPALAQYVFNNISSVDHHYWMGGRGDGIAMRWIKTGTTIPSSEPWEAGQPSGVSSTLCLGLRIDEYTTPHGIERPLGVHTCTAASYHWYICESSERL